MRRNVLILFFLFTAGKLFASDIQWSEGSLVLNNKQVLCGKIAVELKYDMVLFKSDDKVDVYPAHSVQSVFYYDATANVNRKFIVLASGKYPMKKPYLYEVVLFGNVQIVRHLKDVSIAPYADADDFSYFIRTEDCLTPLEKFRKRLYDDMLHEGGLELSVFVTEQHLDPNVSAHAIMIVEEYNRLMKSHQAMARQ
jgi:hypothetical protein